MNNISAFFSYNLLIKLFFLLFISTSSQSFSSLKTYFNDLTGLPEIKAEYVRDGGVTILRPKDLTELKLKNGIVSINPDNLVSGEKLAAGTKIMPKILFQKEEEKTENNTKNKKSKASPPKPLLINGEIYVGFTYPNEDKLIGILPIKRLTRNYTTTPRTPPQTPPPPESLNLDNVLKLLQQKEKEYCLVDSYQDKTPLDLVREFHNGLCNQKVPEGKSYRTALIEKWDKFIREKSVGSQKAEQLAKKAKEIDLTARTALYESTPYYGCSATGICERDIILLSIRNRARDVRCKNSYSPYGCKHLDDFSGVATAPSQYNIWMERFMNNTYLTSCFLRKDLQDETHKNWEGYANYQLKSGMFKTALLRAEKILYGSDTELENLFSIPSSKLKELKNYYHPSAMSKCNPKDYSNSSWIYAAYVKRGNNYSILRQTRIMHKAVPNDPQKFTFTLYQTNAPPQNKYPQSTIDKDFIDFTHSFDCTAHGVAKDCKFDKIKKYNKSPKWFTKLENMQENVPEITCRSKLSKDNSCKKGWHYEEEAPTVGGPCNTWFIPIAGVSQ